MLQNAALVCWESRQNVVHPTYWPNLKCKRPVTRHLYLNQSPVPDIPNHHGPIDCLLSPHTDRRMPFSQKKRDHISVIPLYNWWVGRDSNSRPTD